jgi:hypothetical protein
MKKIISFACFAMALVPLYSSETFADVMPPGSHYLDRCVTIVNVNDFPDTYVIGSITGPMVQGNEFYVVKSDECLTIGYKFNSFKILTAKKSYVDSVGIDAIDPSNQNVTVYSGSMVSPYGGYVEDSNPIVKESIDYAISSISNGMLNLYELKRVSEYNDGTPKKTETFSGSTAGPRSFPDVPSTQKNFDAISYVYNAGIVQGYSDGTYRPSARITRAEFTKILVGSQFSKAEIDDCLAQKTDPTHSDVGKIGSFPVVPFASFSDVPVGYWAEKYVCTVQRSGIAKGYPDGSYGPDTTISFVEAAKIIINAFQKPMAEDTVWYRPYVNYLSEKRAIPDTILSFDQKITRGEMAEIIWRLKENITTKTSKTYSELAQ